MKFTYRVEVSRIFVPIGDDRFRFVGMRRTMTLTGPFLNGPTAELKMTKRHGEPRYSVYQFVDVGRENMCSERRFEWRKTGRTMDRIEATAWLSRHLEYPQQALYELEVCR